MENNNTNRVTIIDIQMPFWSMVVFMVKAAIAAIPAFFILSVIGSLIMLLFSGMMGGMGRW
jgi:hypothetical protein